MCYFSLYCIWFVQNISRSQSGKWFCLIGLNCFTIHLLLKRKSHSLYTFSLYHLFYIWIYHCLSKNHRCSKEPTTIIIISELSLLSLNVFDIFSIVFEGYFYNKTANNINRNYFWFVKLTASVLPSAFHYKLSNQNIHCVISHIYCILFFKNSSRSQSGNPFLLIWLDCFISLLLR